MKLIDADALIMDYITDDAENDSEIISRNDILNAPAVDAVEVVRCKDCKRHEYEKPGMVYCPIQIGGWRHENWFCAAGERRTE